MTDLDKKDKNDMPTEKLFQIMDEIIHQLNKTKKIFLTLLIAHLIIVPIVFVVIFSVFILPFVMSGGPWMHNNSDPWPGQQFATLRFIPIIAVLVWLGVGIRQWLVLSKWTKKYELYKKLQKKIDEKLDFDDDEVNDSGSANVR